MYQIHKRDSVSLVFERLLIWVTSICSHKKQEDSLETRAVLLIFSLELEIFGVAVQSIHQNSEKWWLSWGIAEWNGFGTVIKHFLLLWPCCHGFWVSSEDRYRSKIRRSGSSEDRYARVSQMLLVCYYLLNS